MTGLNEVLCAGALILLLQFVAAILGPRALKVVSILLILAAAGVAVYLGNLALNSEFAGEGADARDMATNFGAIAVLAIIGYFAMRGFFRCMARGCQA